MKTACITGLFVVGSTFAAGCGGPGQAAELVRPKDPTASAALGESACRDVAGKPGEPLVVDWKPEQRGDLEVAMKEGVAVVSYSCKTIKVLSDCHLEGKYGFLGMTRKEEVVQLANADEVSVNLPLSGGKIGGEMQRGATLDIALVMIGKKKTTWDAPTKIDLKGTCTEATHFVRGATVGAFAMGTGTQGKVRASAELFGAGGSAGSTSQKSVQNKDGDVSDCQKASPDSEKAPSQCGTPIRLLLQPIAAGRGAEPESPPKGAPPADKAKLVSLDEADACPAGLVFSEGKCTSPATAPTHQCKSSDTADCTEQCNKGHAGSCAELGLGYANRNEYAKAAPVLEKGCDGGAPRACSALGVMAYAGFGMKADASRAVSLHGKACEAGDAIGCRELGRNTQFGTGAAKDEKRAFGLYQKACDGGDFTGCSFVGASYTDGIGVEKNASKALEFKRRACDGGHPASCAEAAAIYESGAAGVGKNEILAKMLYERGCWRATPGFEQACGGLGRMEWVKSPASAKTYVERGCAFRDAPSCALLKVGYGEPGRAVFSDANKTTELMKKCNAGDAHGCALLGLMQSATMSPQVGKSQVQRACSMNDSFGCALAKKLP